ncbi:unnamed protein product, partial [Coccothraustes coccothraustes]
MSSCSSAGADAAEQRVRGLRAAPGGHRRLHGLLALHGGGRGVPAEPEHRGAHGAARRPLARLLLRRAGEGALRGLGIFPGAGAELGHGEHGEHPQDGEDGHALPMVSLFLVFTAFVISNVGHIRPRGPSWPSSRASSSSSRGAGVMSVYLFTKRYAEEELCRAPPHLLRPRLSTCSGLSGQFLQPRAWPRARSPSDASLGRVLLTAVGAFAAFGLMAIAIGTDYWLYARARVCNATNATALGTTAGTALAHGGLTHSGLWRVCCLEGLKRGLCLRINHFPEDLEYDHDSAEYLLRVVRASSIFPILSAVLLLLGGLCVAASRLRRARTSLVLGAGILFVAAGLSNIIGVIVYISANAGGEASPGGLPSPPRRDGERRPSPYSYGWSFYFGACPSSWPRPSACWPSTCTSSGTAKPRPRPPPLPHPRFSPATPLPPRHPRPGHAPRAAARARARAPAASHVTPPLPHRRAGNPPPLPHPRSPCTPGQDGGRGGGGSRPSPRREWAWPRLRPLPHPREPRPSPPGPARHARPRPSPTPRRLPDPAGGGRGGGRGRDPRGGHRDPQQENDPGL